MVRMSPVVSAVELRGILDEVTLLDVRYRLRGPLEAEYAAGHIPGAAYVDLDRDLAAPPGAGGRHPLPDPAVFEAAMRWVGVRNDRPVVVYDDWSGHAAGRAWWLLRHHGHADVRVLDGGLSAWVADGGSLDTEVGEVTGGDFAVTTSRGMPVVAAEDVLDVPVLVDARAAERYRGEVEPVDPVAGHIPGAVNVPTTANLRADGRFRSADELRALYAAAGVTGEAEVAAYCGSGVTATHDVIALEIAGIRAALYPGSWSGWIADPERPIETGVAGPTSESP
jgi:thiosulfate/3-mercaptopyruvate sulfurtransferase